MDDAKRKELMAFYKATEGVDENGEPRAVAALQVQSYTVDAAGRKDMRVVDEATTTSAMVAFSVKKDRVSIALMFEEFDDIERIRMKAVCDDFVAKANPLEDRELVLTLTDSGVFEHFMTAVTMAHIVDRDKPYIRFLCQESDVFMNTLRDEDRQEIIDAMEEQQQRSMAEAFR